jgi:hypothetical protein
VFGIEISSTDSRVLARAAGGAVRPEASIGRVPVSSRPERRRQLTG